MAEVPSTNIYLEDLKLLFPINCYASIVSFLLTDSSQSHKVLQIGTAEMYFFRLEFMAQESYKSKPIDEGLDRSTEALPIEARSEVHPKLQRTQPIH